MRQQDKQHEAAGHTAGQTASANTASIDSCGHCSYGHCEHCIREPRSQPTCAGAESQCGTCSPSVKNAAWIQQHFAGRLLAETIKNLLVEQPRTGHIVLFVGNISDTAFSVTLLVDSRSDFVHL